MTTNRTQLITQTLTVHGSIVPGNRVVPVSSAGTIPDDLLSVLRIFLVSASIILGIDLLIGNL